MTPTTKLTFLGRSAIEVNGRAVNVQQLGRSKLVVVLAIIALSGESGVTRGDMVNLLWPDETERDGKANLRRHLHDVKRRVFGVESLPLEAGSLLRWNRFAPVWCDAVLFERAEMSGAANLEAINLYQGDFLPEFDDEWVIAQRDRFRESLINRLRIACEEQEHIDPFSALGYAQRWLALDELDEIAARNVIKLQMAVGQRARAYVTYDTLKQKLHESIGVAPEPATIELIDSLTRAC